jgi:hypothetical protein
MKRFRIVTLIVAATYVVGAPVAAYLEYRSQLLSQRFDYPSIMIYAVCAIQLACAAALLSQRFMLLSLAALTVIALGAVGSHFRIGSPLTALPSIVYVLVQLSLIAALRRKVAADRGHDAS